MPLSAGMRVGPYEILAPIGAGGMGEVYQARDTRLDRTVAIKTLRDGHLQHFEREARAIAALNHPNICTLHDIGPDYLVMEYIDGVPLKGPLPVEEAVPIALQIAGALEAAHAKGIVHRDLKPGNILVTGKGVKLLDFGLAKVVEAPVDNGNTVTATQAGIIVGTAAYMSPEQAEGKPVDARSDIFSFGLVLHEMLSGRRAFSGETAISTIAAILYQQPEGLQAPAELQNVVARCLEKQPDRRFQTMTEVREALERQGPATDNALPHSPSIAVLPFANMSGDKENEYFGDGLAEEIINALTKVPGLKVIARTSAFAFKGKQEDIRKIAEALGVANVLEGSVRKAGNRVRITAQLIGAADGSHLWSDRFDREMTDIFAIQDEISGAIVSALRLKLGHEPERPTVNLEAYNAYLEGRYYLPQLTSSGMSRACQCFDRAAALDPNYAMPHAGLAEYYYDLAMFVNARPHEVMPAALTAAQRAIQLNPADAEAYVMRGLARASYQYNWAAAGEDFARAIELNPSFALAYNRRAVWYLHPLGRLDEALAQTRRALELDPLSLTLRISEATVLHLMGKGQEAVERARAVIELFPNFWLSCLLCGSVLSGLGFHDEAAAIVRKGLEIDPGNVQLLGYLARGYRQQGNSHAAETVMEQLDELSRKQYVAASAFAIACSGSSDSDASYRWLDKAVDEREPMAVILFRNPLLAEVQSHPRYPDLLRKMNLA